MSSLIGRANERWSLSRAIDALRDSARQAGRPGLVWIVGFLYPSVGIGLSWLSSPVSHSNENENGEVIPLPAWLPIGLCIAICVSITCFPLFRLVAGLARVSPAEAWVEACEGGRSPRIRTLWKNGAGMTLSVIALWLLLVITIGLALFVIAWPAAKLVDVFGPTWAGDASNWLAVLLLGPLVLLFASYALSMTILTQLALHSLAHNHRGIGSALLHGWRIMRHDVSATVRAVIVDVLLTVAILMATTMLGSLTPGDWLDWVDWVVGITLTGFAGVARAAYWARAYRALGGLSPDDGVPGLPQTV